ncbi:MAG: hypothetical protein WKF58_18140 [Ilumatobacteraceae bacterium]
MTQPATMTSGSSPRNTHRQPTTAEARSAIVGPITPGTTHAVDKMANILGRNEAGYMRPMAT